MPAGTPVFDKPTESVEAIHAWSPERHNQETQAFIESDRGHIANLLERATVSEDAVYCLAAKSRNLLGGLFRLVAKENKHAARYFAAIMRDSCARMNRLARSRPELFRPVTRLSWKWPVMKSLHPHLSDDHETLLRDLQLGQDTPLELDKSARWKLDKAAEYAFALVAYIYEARRTDVPQTDYVASVTHAARALPEFNDDSSQEWWELAKEILLVTYPEPQNVSEFATLVTAPSHRRSGGRMKVRILEILESRFKGFAKPAQPYQT
jgi:hypothetical protein